MYFFFFSDTFYDYGSHDQNGLYDYSFYFDQDSEKKPHSFEYFDWIDSDESYKLSESDIADFNSLLQKINSQYDEHIPSFDWDDYHQTIEDQIDENLSHVPWFSSSGEKQTDDEGIREIFKGSHSVENENEDKSCENLDKVLGLSKTLYGIDLHHLLDHIDQDISLESFKPRVPKNDVPILNRRKRSPGPRRGGGGWGRSSSSRSSSSRSSSSSSGSSSWFRRGSSSRSRSRDGTVGTRYPTSGTGTAPAPYPTSGTGTAPAPYPTSGTGTAPAPYPTSGLRPTAGAPYPTGTAPAPYPTSGTGTSGGYYPNTGGRPTAGSPYPTAGSPYPTSGSGYPINSGYRPNVGSPYATSGLPYPSSGSPYSSGHHPSYPRTDQRHYPNTGFPSNSYPSGGNYRPYGTGSGFSGGGFPTHSNYPKPKKSKSKKVKEAVKMAIAAYAVRKVSICYCYSLFNIKLL